MNIAVRQSARSSDQKPLDVVTVFGAADSTVPGVSSSLKVPSRDKTKGKSKIICACAGALNESVNVPSELFRDASAACLPGCSLDGLCTLRAAQNGRHRRTRRTAFVPPQRRRAGRGHTFTKALVLNGTPFGVTPCCRLRYPPRAARHPGSR